MGEKTSAQKFCQYGGSAVFVLKNFTILGRFFNYFEAALGRCPYIGRGLSWAVKTIGTVYQQAKQAYQPFCGAKSPKNSSDAQRDKQGGVYVLRNKETGQVMRTGRTNDFERRELEHKRDPILGKYDFKSVHPTNSYPEQRGLEQNVHMDYKAPLDKISPISPNNPRRDEYMKAAEEFLERNNEN